MSRTPANPTPSARDPRPWWRFKMMWLVVGGPLVVVVASFVTLALALKHPDEVIQTADRVEADQAAQAPAMQGRNHAATGGVK
ncbi:MAG: uncharacterized protein QG612_1373 [Pseudomonadota bacterium]|nr:uncharacterized protein [Pseudomonadota bacterium]